MKFKNEELREIFYRLPTDMQVFFEDFSCMLAKIEMALYVEAIVGSDVVVRVTDKF